MEQGHLEEHSGTNSDHAAALMAVLPLPAFLFSFDDDGSLQPASVSPEFQRLLTSSGRPDLAALTSPDELEALTLACRNAMHHPHHSFPFHIRNRADDGSMRCFAGHAVRLADASAALGLALLCDVSGDEEMHRLMAKEMRDSALQTLVAGLVHDFRNTLTHIIGTTELLMFKCEDPEASHDLGRMLKSAEQGADMLTRLQHMIRFPSESMQSSAHDFLSLPTMLELLRNGLPARIGMQYRLQNPLPPVAMAEAQIRQLLLALIANAAEACVQEGKIEVLLSATAEHRFNIASPALLIRVNDDGVGIKREHLDEVTRPFWTTHDDPGKLGLGLAIVSRLVRLHGGRLDIQSRPGAGTSVTVLLPAAAEASTIQHEETTPHRQAALAGRPEPSVANHGASDAMTMKPWTILLVDDNPEVLQVHQGMLERMGHRVLTAINGFDALNSYNSHPDAVDLLVTDFRMPGMDGVDLSVELRKLRNDLPVLMITAFGDADKLQQLQSMRISLLDKPVSYGRLEQMITFLQDNSSR